MPTIGDVPERQTAFLGNIASAFAGIAGVEAVAWCGSAALQKADFLSHYDLYVYWRTPVPLSARKKIIESRASEYQLDNNFWELEDEWIEPDGLRFNVMYRPCWEAEEEVHRRLVQHVASLGYTTVYCFSLSQGNSLTDHNSWLADLQCQTRGTYPRGLLQAILRKNRPVLGGGMQSCYFQQINTAIIRQDPDSLNHRVAAWLSSYFDITASGVDVLIVHAADPAGIESALKEASAITPAEGIAKMETIFQVNPNVKVVGCTGSGGSVGANEAAKAGQKITDDFGIFAADATQPELVAMKANEGVRMSVTITGTNKVIAGKVWEMVEQLASGKPVATKEVYRELIPVTKANVDEFYNK